MALYSCKTEPEVSVLVEVDCDQIDSHNFVNTIVFFDAHKAPYLSSTDYHVSESNVSRMTTLAWRTENKKNVRSVKKNLLQTLRKENCNFVLIDFSCEAGRRLMQKHKINFFPTFLRFDNEGKEVCRNIGENQLNPFGNLFDCKNVKSMDHYFLPSPTCDELNIVSLSNTIIYFDAVSIIDAQEYPSSPSSIVKNELLNDVSFIDQLKQDYNFLVVNEACDRGKKIMEKFKIQNFPSILKTDLNGLVIMEKVGLQKFSKLKIDILKKDWQSH